MKAIKKIALCLAVLFVMQAMPIGVFAVSFKDALSEDSRGISVLAHYVKEDAGRQVCFTSTNIIRRQL